MVVFRLRGENALTEQLLKRLNSSGERKKHVKDSFGKNCLSSFECCNKIVNKNAIKVEKKPWATWLFFMQ